jgi:hypothetical protein
MPETWQRRAAGTIGLVALIGITLLMVFGLGARLGGSLSAASSASVAAATDHTAFVALPESRPTFAFVETLTILGLGLVLLAGVIDHHGVAALVVGTDGAVRHRRWRARLVGAPPVLS